MLAELMLIFILANFGKDVIAESNCTPTLCKLRFELASEVHALRNYGGCNDVYLMDCICNRTIDVQFIEHPPYIYADAKTGKVVGLLVGKFIFELSSPENSMCFLFWKNTNQVILIRMKQINVEISHFDKAQIVTAIILCDIFS